MKNYHATLMVVDDDPNDLFLIERAFRAIGVTGPIHTINGGLEAIAYMKGEGKYSDRTAYTYPTFITTDLKMPQADGFAVLEQFVIAQVVFYGAQLFGVEPGETETRAESLAHGNVYDLSG